jgi:molybdopterin-dependent oxidoreductase alpha subunit
MLKTVWQNRHALPYAWRILTQGVCDGCALGVSGLKDWTMRGPHLCSVRLNLLSLNTMPPLEPERLRDVSELRRLRSRELRSLGRIPFPMLRRPGDKGFTRIDWEEAAALAAEAFLRSGADGTAAQPRFGVYLTSRGILNEVYYACQKAVRAMGSSNVDNAARVCHAPSTIAMRRTLGVAASTCSYSDWIGTDLLVFVGSDAANNQPVSTKYMYYAKKAGTRIVLINALREPAMERYWVPSAAESALFGTRMADDTFLVHTGGDAAFFLGVLKHLVEKDLLNREFLSGCTVGFEAAAEEAVALPWEKIERESGAPRAEIMRFAEMLGTAKSAVFIWSMGITQHAHGVQNVCSLLNVALARGFVGREKCGLMPIRGHSGVQGGAEMGAYSTALPGGLPINARNAEHFEELWGFPVPDTPGLNAVQMLDACAEGRLDLLYCIGGNFLEVLPDPASVERALQRVPVRIHHDIVLSSQMLTDPNELVLVLPATTRFEMPGGGCETSTERRVIFSPEIRGPRIPEARSEWQVLTEIAARVRPDRAAQVLFSDTTAIRHEIARAVPFYAGIERLEKQGDQFQWGGTRLCEGGLFPTEDGRAHLQPISLTETAVPEGWFRLSTRRGKQFNSMVHAERDPVTGTRRDAVFICREDAERLQLQEGDRVELHNPAGSLTCRVHLAPLRQGNLQVFWPEGNVLISSGRCDESGVPDYNALVQIRKAADAAPV